MIGVAINILVILFVVMCLLIWAKSEANRIKKACDGVGYSNSICISERPEIWIDDIANRKIVLVKEYPGHE